MSEYGKRPLPKTTSLTDGLKSKFDWDHIRVFAAIAETGSLSGAARLLGNTPGSVSKRLDELEARLGARLFNRQPNGMSLTELGAAAHDFALTAQRAMSSFERIVATGDKRPEGRVTIASTDGIAAYVLAPQLGAFLKANPKIQVAVECGLWSSNPLPDDPDLVITVEEEKRLDYVAAPLATLHYLLTASRDYLDIYGAPKTLEEVTSHRFVEFAAMQRQRQAWHPRSGPLRDFTQFSIQHNSSAVHFESVKGGAGIGLIPSFLLPPNPDLEVVWPEPMSSIQLYLVYRRDALKSARVRLTANWIKSQFEATQRPWFRDEFIDPDQFEKLGAVERSSRARQKS